jgi:hypothetical protein
LAYKSTVVFYCFSWVNLLAGAMAHSEFDEHVELASNLSEDSATLPRTLWPSAILRNKAAPYFEESLNLAIQTAPGDGECLIHSLTRSLGILPPKTWDVNKTWDWARLFRLHLARHISGEDDLNFLYGNDYLEDRFATLFARLWRLRITAHPLMEFPRRQLFFPPVQFYPLQVDDDLLDVQLLCYVAHHHFDYLVPVQRNFYPHTISISAKDWRSHFPADNLEAEARLDRFIFTWLDILRSPNPDSADGAYRFSSMAQFLSTFPEQDWQLAPVLDALLTYDNSVFTNNNEEVLMSIQDATGGMEDGVSSDSTAGINNVAAPTSARNSTDRY